MTQPIVIESFAANTGQFTVIGQGSHGPGSFAITGGQGVFTNAPSGGSPLPTIAVDTANMPVSPGSPAIFVYAVIGAPGIPRPPAGVYANLMPGIALNTANNIQFELGASASTPLAVTFDILMFTSGVQRQLAGNVVSPSSAIEAVGFSLEGNIARGWGRFSGVWTLLAQYDVSAIFDFTAPGATTGWHASVGAVSDAGMTTATSELWSGPPLVLVTVPNVVGEDVTTATANLLGVGLVVGTVTPVLDPAPPGTILTQTPTGGTVVLSGTSVNMTESAGPSVPNVVNTSATSVAPGILSAAGFVVGTITYAPSVLVIAGNVVRQSPIAGAAASPGSPVSMVVSTGRGPVVVPDLIDLTSADATTAILNIGLVVGAVSFRESLTIPVGEVIAQNPQGGTPVASGTLVSYVISTGPPTAVPEFDVLTTVISQYANSPSLLSLVQSFAGYVDQTLNFVNFYNFVWNVDTAQGFGLDIWGRIVNVSRLLQIPTGQRYVGFKDGTGPAWDVEPFGKAPGGPPGAGGAGTWYTPISATTAYLLEDEPYRQLILTKALANIVNTTVPAFNLLLQNLFPGRGNPYVTTSGPMAMVFHFDFALTPIELAILEQSGAVPVPPGVAFTIVTPP